MKFRVTEYPEDAAKLVRDRGSEPQYAGIYEKGPDVVVMLYSIDIIDGFAEKHVSVSRSKNGVRVNPRQKDIDAAVKHVAWNPYAIKESFLSNKVHHAWLVDNEVNSEADDG